MTKSFDELKMALDSINRDRDAQADVEIKNDGEQDDSFIASWKYPVKNGMRMTGNYIQVSYRFKMDIHHLMLLWEKKYDTGFVHLKDTLSECFFEIYPHLYDVNGKGDDYTKILELLYSNRGAGMAKHYNC